MHAGNGSAVGEGMMVTTDMTGSMHEVTGRVRAGRVQSDRAREAGEACGQTARR